MVAQICRGFIIEPQVFIFELEMDTDLQNPSPVHLPEGPSHWILSNNVIFVLQPNGALNWDINTPIQQPLTSRPEVV